MQGFHENLISVDAAGTLDGLFARRIARTPDRPAYRYFDRNRDQWCDYSWREMGAAVARWQRALAAEELATGDRVAIQLRNCPEWVMFDQAALSLGLVTVPLYTDDRPDNIAYILEEAEVRLLLVQDAGRWRRLDAIIGDEAPLRRVLLLDGSANARDEAERDPRIRVVDSWLPDVAGEFHPSVSGRPNDLASIVYTSGTTGRSKGVMLSHHNMLSVAHGGVTLLDVYQEDLFLSFLPLSHTLERSAGYYLPIMTGSCVAYARSVGQLAEDLVTIRPTAMIAVPRIFERVYARIAEQMEQKGRVASALFNLAVRVGWQRFLYRQGRGRWSPALLLWPLLDRLVASKVTAKLGGRMRIAVSGGAALPLDVARVFIGLGLPIVQGYGLTETAPVISVNPLEDNRPESVGVPIHGARVRIGEHDELLVRGPGVMLGYWNDHRATRHVIDADGWLHTGDQARIDASGHLYITGRLKDILILSNGEKIPPVDMEMAIALDPLIDQVIVVGEGRPYLGALVVLDAIHWGGLAQGSGLDPMDRATLQQVPMQQLVMQRIRAALRGFPGYAKIRRVHLTLEPWTIDDGLLTPTLKVKRAKVLERFAGEIEAMYQSGPTGA